MKKLISDIAEQFYEHIIKSHFFASFFIDKDLERIKKNVILFIYEQLTSNDAEQIQRAAYSIGVQHANNGIPLNNVLNFVDFFQHKIFKHCEENRGECSELKVDNIEIMKNSFAKGFLHESINNADIIAIPLFSVLSTTKVATSIISWISDVNTAVLNDGDYGGIGLSNDSCNLATFLNKPFFNMIFESDDNFHEFHKMHAELHSTASSLFYFIEIKSYAQAYFVYNDFIDQCKSFLNYYFERIVLFEQNNQNYFYKIAEKKIGYGKKINIFTFNIRNMQMINKIWGLETGDHIINEVERHIDKYHGMNSTDTAFIKTKNAEFIVLTIDKSHTDSIKAYNSMREVLSNILLNTHVSISDVKIASSFLPLEGQPITSGKFLRKIVQQAILLSKAREDNNLVCNADIIADLIQHVNEADRVRYFIKQSFDSKNFKPYYHTIYHTQTGEVSHAEALARVCDKDSCISAFTFIDYLVDTGRVVELDIVMLGSILNDYPSLSKKLTKIFINISPKSLRSAVYVDVLKDFIIKAKRMGMEHVFEITEQSLFDNVELVRTLSEDYGSTFAIDDFGSGYSNFSIVSELAQEGLVKYIKIDGSLVKDIHSNIYKQNIVTGIIQIARSMGMKTIAEFVADEDTADMLMSLRCTYMQGFHYSLPQPVEFFEN